MRRVFLFLVGLTLFVHDRANAERWRVVETQTGLAGATELVRAAGAIGAAIDFHGRWTTLGVEASALAGETDFQGQGVLNVTMGGHGRLFLLPTSLAPYVEGGLALYQYYVTGNPSSESESSLINLGPSIGLGIAYRPRSGFGIRLGGTAHFARIDAGVDGAEDADGHLAMTLGLSWLWGRSAGTTD